jgi:hypothetical protein
MPRSLLSCLAVASLLGSSAAALANNVTTSSGPLSGKAFTSTLGRTLQAAAQHNTVGRPATTVGVYYDNTLRPHVQVSQPLPRGFTSSLQLALHNASIPESVKKLSRYGVPGTIVISTPGATQRR